MLEARSDVLEMLEVKEDKGFGRLDDGSPKVKWLRRMYPRVDYTHGPWTVVMLRQPSQSIHTSREAYTFRRWFRITYFFSWAPLLISNTADRSGIIICNNKSSTESDSTFITITYTRYNIYAGVPSKLYVANTHTHTRTVTELFVYILLYSSLYLFEYSCFHLNSGTVHPDIVHRNRKRSLLFVINR